MLEIILFIISDDSLQNTILNKYDNLLELIHKNTGYYVETGFLIHNNVNYNLYKYEIEEEEGEIGEDGEDGEDDVMYGNFILTSVNNSKKEYNIDQWYNDKIPNKPILNNISDYQYTYNRNYVINLTEEDIKDINKKINTLSISDDAILSKYIENILNKDIKINTTDGIQTVKVIKQLCLNYIIVYNIDTDTGFLCKIENIETPIIDNLLTEFIIKVEVNDKNDTFTFDKDDIIKLSAEYDNTIINLRDIVLIWKIENSVNKRLEYSNDLDTFEKIQNSIKNNKTKQIIINIEN